MKFRCPYLLATISLVALQPSLSFSDSNNNVEYDDWIVNYSCTRASNKLCNGYYQEPPFLDGPISDDEPMTITSDEGDFVAKGTSVFTGNVVAKKGKRWIYSDKAIVVHNEESGELEKITAIGHVKILEPGMRVDGSQAEYLVQADKKVIYDARYRLYQRHARGQAHPLTIMGEDTMILPGGGYTTCPPGNQTWYLKTKETKLNTETGRGEAWHSKLYLQKVPVFYWPYVNFPIDDRRQTGFLFPSFGHDSDNGIQLSTPFYWNIAPNYDLTFTPTVMSERGIKLDSEFRYLTKVSGGKVEFDFLPDDRGYQKFYDKKWSQTEFTTGDVRRRVGLRQLNKRYRFAIKNISQFNRQWFVDIDYNRVGDDNYMNDFHSNMDGIAQSGIGQQISSLYQEPNTISGNHMLQKAKLTYNQFFGTAYLNVEQYQTLYSAEGPGSAEQFRKLPEIGVHSSIFDLPFGLEWSAITTYTDFKLRSLSESTNAYTTGARYHLRPQISRPFMEPGWYVVPRVQVNYVNYSNLTLTAADLNNGKLDNSNRTIPIYDVKSGLIFERPFALKHEQYAQTLEPKFYYLYVPEKDQGYLPTFDSGAHVFDYSQVYRDNRYGGYDRVSEANQMAIGLESRFSSTDTGEEKMVMGIGRIRYFRDRTLRLGEAMNVSKHWSPLAAMTRVNLTPYWSVEGNIVRESHVTRTGTLNLQYRPESTNVINFGYQFNRDNNVDPLSNLERHTKQVNLSTAWALTPSWRVLGKFEYDLKLHRQTTALGGFEYHTCCSIIRVAWHKQAIFDPQYLRRTRHSIVAQLVLKGFAGVGQINQGFVKGAIPGYDPQENAF